jgi:hypothetical protein
MGQFSKNDKKGGIVIGIAAGDSQGKTVINLDRAHYK